MKFDNLINELRKIAKFEKVSYQQFKKDMIDTYGEISDESIKEIYDGIKLPKRATTGSAGYDFFAPFAFLWRSAGHGTWESSPYRSVCRCPPANTCVTG